VLAYISAGVQSNEDHTNDKEHNGETDIRKTPPKSRENYGVGEFWSDVYYDNTVSRFDSEAIIKIT